MMSSSSSVNSAFDGFFKLEVEARSFKTSSTSSGVRFEKLGFKIFTSFSVTAIELL